MVPIYEHDGSPDDAIVRVVGPVACTGTLIAPDLVLTAHQCVSKRDARGLITNEDVGPASIVIQLGGDDFAFADVRVRTFVTPNCDFSAGNGDIAILILSRKLIGFPIWSLRPASTSETGDQVVTMGFGHCAVGGTLRRQLRSSGRVVARGHVLSGARAEGSESVCPGDEGGPVFAFVNDSALVIVGVVSSAAAHGGEPGAYDYTPVDAYPDLVTVAQGVANGAVPPPPPCSATSKSN